MWKKGELVWVSLNPSDSWIPGRIVDPSEPFGILVSFFDLMKPRYVPKTCIRSFVRNFKTLVADSWRFRHFVDRALQTLFWNISFRLWCSCQSPIDSPYLDRGISHPLFPPRSSDSALSYVREMAVAKRVPLRRLAKTNSLTAQILSFKRYTVDINLSESVYEEVIESANLMDCAEEPDWYLDPSYKMNCIDDLGYMFPETEDADLDDSSDSSLRDTFPKDIHCCSVDGVAQSWNTRSPLISSSSGVMKACATMARVSSHEGVVKFETDVQVEEEHTSAVEELEDRNDHVEEENEMDVEDEKGHSETSDKDDETSKREEEVEIDSRNSTLVGEESLNCSVGECCEVEKSSCLLNSEFPDEDILEEATTVAHQREAAPDVMIETHDDITGSDDRTLTSAKQLSPLLDASNDKAFLAKPVSFVVLEDCKNLESSMEVTYANPRSKLDSSMISANTLDEDRSDRNNCNGTSENCPDDTLESHLVDVGQVPLHLTGSSNKEFGSDAVDIAPAEQLQNLEVATNVKNQTSAVDSTRSTGVKRKASRDKASDNSKRRNKASQQSISADKSKNLQLLKDKRFANPKCLRMKFLSTHVSLPSKSELLKRFSVFGKIDASRTDVNPGQSSAKVVFLHSIDAVTAYQFARSKKFKLGRSKVLYRLDAFEGDSEVNKVPLSQPQQSVPSPRSCLKKHGSVDNEEGRSHLNVKFQMGTNP